MVMLPLESLHLSLKFYKRFHTNISTSNGLKYLMPV